MNETDDFKRRFPQGFGEPIIRHKCKYPNGDIVYVHEGGPVDLKDPNRIAQEVSTLLKIQPYEPATREEVYARATNHVKGIIYKEDRTYRCFVWLTVSRNYLRRARGGSRSEDRGVGDGDREGKDKRREEVDEDETEEVWTKTVKMPFLIWMGSACSFLSFDAVDIFFSDPEFEYSRFQLTVDAHPFLFHGPDDNSSFNHYNILGRDFMESRFRTFDANYENLTVLMKRRKRIMPVSGQPASSKQGDASRTYRERENDEKGRGSDGERKSEKKGMKTRREREGDKYSDRERHGDDWVRRRDEDLERYLEEDEEDSDEEGAAEGFKTPEEEFAANIDPRLIEASVAQQILNLESMGVEEEGVMREKVASEPFQSTTAADGQGDSGGRTGLRERKTVDSEPGLIEPPVTTSPISKKEGKRSGLVSKENMRISGGRTGSGMRR